MTAGLMKMNYFKYITSHQPVFQK